MRIPNKIKTYLPYFYLLFIFIIFILDQALKNYFFWRMTKNASNKFLQVHLYLNSGIAFNSSISHYGWIYLIIETLLVIIIFCLLYRYKLSLWSKIVIISINIGIIGNIIDRMHTRNFSIIDWFLVNNTTYMNLSDLVIVLNIFLLLILISWKCLQKKNL